MLSKVTWRGVRIRMSVRESTPFPFLSKGRLAKEVVRCTAQVVYVPCLQVLTLEGRYHHFFHFSCIKESFLILCTKSLQEHRK